MFVLSDVMPKIHYIGRIIFTKAQSTVVFHANVSSNESCIVIMIQMGGIHSAVGHGALCTRSRRRKVSP